MSKIANAMLTLEDMYIDAKERFESIVHGMDRYGYNTAAAAIANHHYGAMLNCASVSAEILGDQSLLDDLNDMRNNGEIKLSKSDFERK